MRETLSLKKRGTTQSPANKNGLKWIENFNSF